MRAIDDLMPHYDRREVHRRSYPASPGAVRAALEAVSPSELPLTRVLFAVRSLGRGLPGGDRPMLERLAASGFARLVDTPEEVVLATIGQFWRPDGGRRPAASDVDAFRAFAEPGYAKGVMSFEFRALPSDGAEVVTEVVTETRVLATSAGARRAFSAYWVFVRGGSGLIRREILAAAARKLGIPRSP